MDDLHNVFMAVVVLIDNWVYHVVLFISWILYQHWPLAIHHMYLVGFGMADMV